ncbi:hypothetical protein Fmac_017696 [Flemingia macrophylla]|uniref:F-box/LRR-repeat protein 15/At3g58940/PEG3-like LRR domain-containing protein n=1 Tax=Flemingia macrophylla TaxID=520843 RepID=A0ABD1M2W8_9FABA
MVPSLNFHCTKPITYYNIKKILRLRATQTITRFHLNCEDQDYSRTDLVNKWVGDAIRGSVEQLSISLCNFYQPDPIILIPSLFTCTTLVTLNLNFSGPPVCLLVPSSVHLPSLKTLQLERCVHFSCSRRLFYGSPSLELFRLKQADGTGHAMEMEILRSSRSIRLLERKVDDNCEIIIESDRDYDFIQDYIEGHFEKLVKVKVHITVRQSRIFNPYGYEYISLLSFRALKELSNVEVLFLSDFFPWRKYIGHNCEGTYSR